MEFAVVSVGETILSGARPLRNWGQDAEVISRFPRSCRDADGGGGDANGGGNGGEEDGFVEGLADFCFPSGAQMYLVEGGIVSTYLGLYLVNPFKSVRYDTARCWSYHTQC